MDLETDPDPSFQVSPYTDTDPGFRKGRPSYMRSLPPLKQTSYISKNKIDYLFSIFVGHFCPPGSRSGLRIRKQIYNTAIIVDRFIVLLESHPANNISCDVYLLIDFSRKLARNKKICELNLVHLICYSQTNCSSLTYSVRALIESLRKFSLSFGLDFPNKGWYFLIEKIWQRNVLKAE